MGTNAVVLRGAPSTRVILEDTSSDMTRPEIAQLTRQFYATLRASLARLSGDRQTLSPRAAKVHDVLNHGSRPSWSRAYEAEQMLVDMIDETNIDVELRIRLVEAQSKLRPALAAQYSKLVREAKTFEGRRALLARLVNDLQWRYTVNEVRRSLSKEITRWTVIIFIAALGGFLPTILLGVPPLGGSRHRLLLLAGAVGAWGASFSMLSSLKPRLEAANLTDLKLMRSRWILWSRPLIGVGAACILYFFLVSGLLGGAVFPNLKAADAPNPDRTRAAAASDGTKPQPGAAPSVGGTGTPASVAAPNQQQANRQQANQQLALFIVWCFLAGFSERLVPALLTKTAAERARSSRHATGLKLRDA